PSNDEHPVSVARGGEVFESLRSSLRRRTRSKESRSWDTELTRCASSDGGGATSPWVGDCSRSIGAASHAERSPRVSQVAVDVDVLADHLRDVETSRRPGPYRDPVERWPVNGCDGAVRVRHQIPGHAVVDQF